MRAFIYTVVLLFFLFALAILTYDFFSDSSGTTETADEVFPTQMTLEKYSKRLSMKQIDSMSSSLNYSFTVANAVRSNTPEENILLSQQQNTQ